MNLIKNVLRQKKELMVFAIFVIAIILVETLIFNRRFIFRLEEQHYSINDGALYQFNLENGNLVSQNNDPNISFDNINIPVDSISIKCHNSIPGAIGQVFYRNRNEPYSELHSIPYNSSLPDKTFRLPEIETVSSLRFDLTDIPGDTITCSEFVLNPPIPFTVSFFRLAIYAGLLISGGLFVFRKTKPINAFLRKTTFSNLIKNVSRQKKELMVFVVLVMAITLVETSIFNRVFVFRLEEQHYSINDGALHAFDLKNGILVAENNDPNITFDNINIPVDSISIKCDNSTPGALGQVFYKRRAEPFSELHSIRYDPSLPDKTFRLPTFKKVSSLRFDLTDIPGDTITCSEFVINPPIPFTVSFFRLAIYAGLLISGGLFVFIKTKPINRFLREINPFLKQKKEPIVLAVFVIAILLVETLIFNRVFVFRLEEQHYSINDGALHAFDLKNGILVAENNDPNITFDNINIPVDSISIKCDNSTPGALGQVFYKRRAEPFSELHSIRYDPSLPDKTFTLPEFGMVSSLRFDLTNTRGDTITCSEFVLNPPIPFIVSFFRLVIYAGLLISGGLFVFRKTKPINAFLWKTNLLNVGLIFFGITLAYYQFGINVGLDKILGGWRYFTGQQGAIKAYGPVISYGEGSGDRSDVFNCLEILKKVPGSAKVLNLNGFAAVEPCLFSPLLPQDKIVHHYEAVAITEPYYQTLMFGEPQAAYKVYQNLGINYFYIRKGDPLFVNLGYSRALEPRYLGQYFDVYAESADFYILTWRGAGLYPVSPQLVREITTWYNNSKDKNYPSLHMWWFGREDLEVWIQTQP